MKVYSHITLRVFLTTVRLTHSGTPVNVFAFGPGAENFQGVMENTDIHDKISRLMRP